MDAGHSIGSILTATDEQFLDLYAKNNPESTNSTLENLKKQYKFLERCINLRELARKNFESLVKRNVDPLLLLEHMQSLSHVQNSTLASSIIGNLRVDTQIKKTESGCILCGHKIKDLLSFKLFDINSQASAEFDEGLLHLIEKHEFYMVDLLDLCRVFNLGLDTSFRYSSTFDFSNSTSSEQEVESDCGNTVAGIF